MRLRACCPMRASTSIDSGRPMSVPVSTRGNGGSLASKFLWRSIKSIAPFSSPSITLIAVSDACAGSNDPLRNAR
jgi:hypothetical protein